MKIEHIAIWAHNLEKMKDFYLENFPCEASKRYHNQNKDFSSYFIRFRNGARIELMYRPDISERVVTGEVFGLAHFAFSTGSKAAVERLTHELESRGIPVINQPRETGDGYYESIILDPEGNVIEITV